MADAAGVRPLHGPWSRALRKAPIADRRTMHSACRLLLISECNLLAAANQHLLVAHPQSGPILDTMMLFLCAFRVFICN
jgi:hypothetical protein